MPIVETMTPRGIELVDSDDFEANWHVVQKGFLLITCYDRKQESKDHRHDAELAESRYVLHR